MEYAYSHAGLSHAHAYLLPACDRLIDGHLARAGRPRRLFDLGCGNGSVAGHFAARGFEVTGIDASDAGIAQAEAGHPGLRLEKASVYDDLAAVYGCFPVVLSLEVVEHLYAPRTFAARLFDLVEPGGIAVVSTPYHGYWKNLVLALSGRFDTHFSPLWDHGHIKFWSPRTLGQLLCEAGFGAPSLTRVGRVRWLAKSMILAARRDG